MTTDRLLISVLWELWTTSLGNLWLRTMRLKPVPLQWLWWIWVTDRDRRKVFLFVRNRCYSSLSNSFVWTCYLLLEKMKEWQNEKNNRVVMGDGVGSFGAPNKTRFSVVGLVIEIWSSINLIGGKNSKKAEFGSKSENYHCWKNRLLLHFLTEINALETAEFKCKKSGGCNISRNCRTMLLKCSSKKWK